MLSSYISFLNNIIIIKDNTPLIKSGYRRLSPKIYYECSPSGVCICAWPYIKTNGPIIYMNICCSCLLHSNNQLCFNKTYVFIHKNYIQMVCIFEGGTPLKSLYVQANFLIFLLKKSLQYFHFSLVIFHTFYDTQCVIINQIHIYT